MTRWLHSQVPAPPPSILDRAVMHFHAHKYSGSGSWRDLSGGGHHAQFGSTAGADTNDPLYLRHEGAVNYLYVPAVDANYGTVPDSAALSVTTCPIGNGGMIW